MLQSLQSFINANDCREAAMFITLGLGRKYFWGGVCCNFELLLRDLS